MEISHPRRILAVSRPDSCLLDLMKGLTGLKPTLAGDSLAGTTHEWPIKTSYYSATVPIWLDEITEPRTWSRDFMTPEAEEVLSVLGAFIVCFRKPIDDAELTLIKDLLLNVGKVVKEGCGYSWDGVSLAVAMPQSSTPFLEKTFDEWDDICQEYGFEFVDFEAKGCNEFSEPIGVERLKQALETNDWEALDSLSEATGLDDFNSDPDSDAARGSFDFDFDVAEIEKEMAGMKQAIYGSSCTDSTDLEDDEARDGEVEKLQTMMLKMQGIRDIGADLPPAARKKLARKTVNELMKTL